MNKHFKSILLFIIGSVLSAPAQQIPTYLDDNQSLENRVEDALARMTLQEKIAMCHAQSKFSSPGVPRLGIPENWTTDGSHGISSEVLWDEWVKAGWTNDSCIAFPALTGLAATWNPEMALLYGKSIGEEARYRNKNILLGPGVNIYRTPLNGRNFEYMGEDPFLASKMVVPYIKGVQSNGVAACVKHFALHNQEVNKYTLNVNVDDRTLYEIYLPAFKAAVQEGNAWAIMGAYNRYKNEWASQNKYLLTDILRNEWNFDGVVVSDWGAVNNTDQAIHSGLDIEFGTWTDGIIEGSSSDYDNYHLAQPFLIKIQSGEVDANELDNKVRNILRLAFRTTMNRNRPWGSLGTKKHGDAARKIAEESIVLLKNENGLLPIDLSKTKNILVVGENAIKMMTAEGGSSSLKAKYEVLSLDGIKNRVGKDTQINFARGYVGNTNNENNSINLSDNRSEKELTEEAVNLAKKADIVIFIGGLNKSDKQDSEGDDRKSLHLPYNQDQLITALSKANKNLVVVNISGNAVAMPWVKKVPTIIQTWYNGSESGNALASVLMGDVNPSGKLPFSFPSELKDLGVHKLNAYPGTDKQVTYKEGIFVGYRWLEKQNIKPLFPFGHGLSYTTFEYGNLSSHKKSMQINDNISFSIKIKNTGTHAGSEVVQFYISDLKSSLPRPKKELKEFNKIFLQPGEEQEITFTIDKNALAFFDPNKHEWVYEKGDFEAIVGASSSDIKSKIRFSLL